MPSIYAGEISEWRPAPDGPVFRWRTLDYWAIQPALAADTAEGKIRATLIAGLVDIDGDAEAVARFVEHPNADLVNRLFDLIWQGSLGNWGGRAV